MVRKSEKNRENYQQNRIGKIINKIGENRNFHILSIDIASASGNSTRERST